MCDCGWKRGHARTCAVYAGLPEFRLSKSKAVVCCLEGVCYLPDMGWHGTPGGYTNHDCRCAPCREASVRMHYDREYQLRYRGNLVLNGKSLNSGKDRQVGYRPRPISRTDRRPNRPVLEGAPYT